MEEEGGNGENLTEWGLCVGIRTDFQSESDGLVSHR